MSDGIKATRTVKNGKATVTVGVDVSGGQGWRVQVTA